EEILHLGALEELHAADDLVSDPLRTERLLQHAGLRVDPVEHGDVARLDAAGALATDRLDDVRRLLALVPDEAHADAVASLLRRPEVLRLPAGGALDDPEGPGDDVLRRAVVLLELHDRRVRKIVAKPQNVADVRAAPAVDGLVVVADDGEVSRRPGE